MAAVAAEGSDEVRSRDERVESKYSLARSLVRSFARSFVCSLVSVDRTKRYHLCHAAAAVLHHVERSPWLMRASVCT